MRNIIVEAEVSLDGVIGGESPDFWAQVFKYHGEDVLDYLKNLLFTPDALLMGRKTYEFFAQVWPSRNGEDAERINSMPKYVVTSKPLQAQWNNSTIVNVEEIAKLKQRPGKDILIEGSATLVESLAQAGLIDEYKLLVHPSVMGCGKRFFKEGMGITKLKLVESKPLSLGVVLLRYEPTA